MWEEKGPGIHCVDDVMLRYDFSQNVLEVLYMPRLLGGGSAEALHSLVQPGGVVNYFWCQSSKATVCHRSYAAVAERKAEFIENKLHKLQKLAKRRYINTTLQSLAPYLKSKINSSTS